MNINGVNGVHDSSWINFLPSSLWWLLHLVVDLNLNLTETQKRELVLFWLTVLDSFIIENHNVLEGQTNTVEYRSEVFKILHNAKGRCISDDDTDSLMALQRKIEELTMVFDEESIFKTTPNVVKKLINTQGLSGKDYLRQMDLTKEDSDLLSELGPYTIEALIVYVLCIVFHSVEQNSLIRVASLVERLEHSVRLQASVLKSRRTQNQYSTLKAADVTQESGKEGKRIKKGKMYPIGTGLVQFMEERKLIILSSDLKGGVRVSKGKNAYYLQSNLYAYCDFDISLLPIKLNLPMICKPLDWKSVSEKDQPSTLSDLVGGYLSGLSGEIYDRYRLQSSNDINNFHICFGKGDNYQKLCGVMNKLQSQAFQINSVWLESLLENEEIIVEKGLLMPRFLASINMKDVTVILRDSYMKNEEIQKIFSFSALMNMLCKNIQRARYEQMILNLAKAYDGYHFYLPAFLDFRGRIYRCGVLHFHERDLARSLIVFADSKSMDKKSGEIKTMEAAAAFHYQSYDTIQDAMNWYRNNENLSNLNNLSFMHARSAKHPFQFLANLKGIATNNLSIPITQDASSSAYQIMSYFLLDVKMAKRTNLITSCDGKINDVYTFIHHELNEFMKDELEKSLYEIVSLKLNRKIVKGIFMPMIYGKTLMSTAGDLKDHFSRFITHKECFEVASVCFKFWRQKYPSMECLIRLIRNIGWIASARDSPVFYRVPYYTTVQDYMIMEAIQIWIYDGRHKKRRRVTLRVSSYKRDRRKTEISTFVNFIHQRDAYLAMSVVRSMLSKDAPIYTVHDNFISTAQYSTSIPSLYSRAFREMGPPLSIINQFIYMNVIQPIGYKLLKVPTEGYFDSKVISSEELYSFLKENVPANISKKMLATWEERIKGVITSYENYTSHVCGNVYTKEVSWQDHEMKWESFELALSLGEQYPRNNYSVHY